MIKSSIRKNTFRAIYRFLDRFSPVPFDCGRICGAACCQADEEHTLGLYLLPGEEKVHDRRDPWLSWEKHSTELYDFPPSWQGSVYFVNCEGPGHCRRALRPIQCRTFPLQPVIREEEEKSPLAEKRPVYREAGSPLALIYYPAPLPYSCPLIEEGARLSLPFLRATYLVWKHLIRDPLIYDWVRYNGVSGSPSPAEESAGGSPLPEGEKAL